MANTVATLNSMTISDTSVVRPREESSSHERQTDAGPSHNDSRPTATAGPSRTRSKPGYATSRHLPKIAFGAIEYPGPMSNAQTITTLATQDEIDDCFNHPAGANSELEIHYRKDRTGTPVKGYRIGTQKLLVKVVKRRRKDGKGGVFTTEVVGPISQTVRFRYHHFTPNNDGQAQQLLTTLRDLDYHTILDFEFPELNETYTIPASPELGTPQDPELSHHSLLDLQPMPVFSLRRLPLVYNFKLSQATATTDYQDPLTGEVKQRHYNTARHVGVSPIVIGHVGGEVPKEPEGKVIKKIPKLNQEILFKMRQLFEERPLWMRHSLLSKFTPDEVKIIVDSKAYIPSCAYMFGAGPFWKCYARIGYDPRQSPESRIYQRTYFYIQVARNRQPIFATPEPGEEEDEPVVDRSTHEAWSEEQERLIREGLRPPFDHSRDHIFDGEILHRDKPDYQLCDIEDSLIKRYINDLRLITDTCTPQTGWYTPTGYEMIKEMIKTKYIHVRDKNEPAPDSICYDLMQAIEDSVVDARITSRAEGQEDEDVEMA